MRVLAREGPSARPAAVADLLASPIFGRFIDDAVETGLRRASIVRKLRTAGVTPTANERQSRAPFAFTRFPIGVAPARFGEPLPVTIDAATIGHAAERRVLPPELWSRMSSALANGRAKRDRHGVVRVFDQATGLFVVLERTDSAWRVRAAFKARRRYFDNLDDDEL